MSDTRPEDDATMEAVQSASFSRPASGLSTVGVLSKLCKSGEDERIRIEDRELLIGRGEASDGIHCSLADENVSRRHARILRIANHFVIEDLNSSNGTFVDGIPIRKVHLHNGDELQIGRQKFLFNQLSEFNCYAANDWLLGNEIPSDPMPPELSLDYEKLTVCFWGTRGSIPTPGAETSKYGGNTTCIEIRYGQTIIVVDAGSGIRELSKSWEKQFAGKPVHANLLFTHLHWDHIQGFPFFNTAYQAGNTIDIFGATQSEQTIEELLSGQMRGAYFPVPISAMKAKLNFHDATQEFSIGPIKIETFGLPHPGGCMGYRFSVGDSVLVLATDSEFDAIALNKEEIASDNQAKRDLAPGLIEWMSGADLLIVDCQYSDLEYREKTGWGHNSIAAVVDLCDQVRPKMLGLFHHDPTSLDPIVSERVHETARRIKQRSIRDTLVFGTREQLCLTVQRPKRPIKN